MLFIFLLIYISYYISNRNSLTCHYFILVLNKHSFYNHSRNLYSVQAIHILNTMSGLFPSSCIEWQRMFTGPWMVENTQIISLILKMHFYAHCFNRICLSLLNIALADSVYTSLQSSPKNNLFFSLNGFHLSTKMLLFVEIFLPHLPPLLLLSKITILDFHPSVLAVLLSHSWPLCCWFLCGIFLRFSPLASPVNSVHAHSTPLL